MAFALIVLMLGLSAFFSGSEIAFVTVNRLKAEVRAQRAGVPGTIVREFLRDPATVLTTTLVGNNVALAVYSTLLSPHRDGPPTRMWMHRTGADTVAGLVLVSQTLVAAVVVLLIGEILPKSLLREPPERAVFALAGPLKLTYWLFLPLIKLAGWTSNALVRLFGAPQQ